MPQALLFAPALSTPLLKIPLLLSHAVFTYYGMTPPRQPPQARELNRFTAPDLMTRSPQYQLAAAAGSKFVLCGVAVAEAVVLLAQQVPSRASDHILSFLLPAARPASIRVTVPSVVGCVLGIAGGFLRVLCHRTLGRFFTWQMAVHDDHELITNGPYGVVRHPSYAGWALMVTGSWMLLLSRGSYFIESGLWNSAAGKGAVIASLAYLTFSTVNLMGRMAKEDTVLRQEFGPKWDAWAKNTPYRLIPFVY